MQQILCQISKTSNPDNIFLTGKKHRLDYKKYIHLLSSRDIPQQVGNQFIII